MDFAFGDQWSAADDMLTPSCVAGVRVLARHFFGIPIEDLRTDSTWSMNTHLEAQCSLQKVMQLVAERERHEAGLSSDAGILVLLACDEYQSLRQAAGVEKASMVTRALATWMVAGER